MGTTGNTRTSQHRAKRLWIGGWVLIFLLLTAACAAPEEPLPAGVLAGSANTETPANDSTSGLDAPLVWQNYAALGNDQDESCRGLRMAANGEVEIIPCNGGGETLRFPGQAELDSEAWLRAIDAWIEFTYGRQTTGQMGAATRTVMSWWLGELPDRPGHCRHLLVLAYGYAYANVDPCQGGQVVSTAEGWLQTAELDAFDRWLYNRAPLFVGDHYFDGRGTQETTEAEIAEMALWAEQVYSRIAEQLAEVATPGSETILIWEAYTTMGSADGTESCMRLTLTANDQATFGPCGAGKETAPLLPVQAEAWAQIRAHFASFAMESADVHLLFKGNGEATGPSWQRALAAWAEATLAELSIGQSSATTHTAMSWWLGPVEDQPGVCKHLVVLTYGFAYASAASCDGGTPLHSAGDWLQDGELATLDAWLQDRAPTYHGKSYLDGIGDVAMDVAEIDAVAQWAAALYARMAE